MAILCGACAVSTSVLAQSTAPRLVPAVRPGEWVRLSWFTATTDSVVCARFREARNDSLIVDQPVAERTSTPCAAPAASATAPGAPERRYAAATTPAFQVYRPHDARQVAWSDARRGLGEGALVGLALGAIFGGIAGRFDDGRTIEDGLLGAGIGLVAGGIGGGLLSFQSGYNSGWLWVTIESSRR
jgi:hypothetical protein